MKKFQDFTQPTVHRSQVAWSLCVAILVAIVVLEQTNSFHHVSTRSSSRGLATPTTLVTGTPINLSMSSAEDSQ